MDARSGFQRTAALTLLALAAVLAGCGDRGEGARAYREGRFDDAHAAFVAASEAEGEPASPELLHDRALAALRAGELRDAESAAQRALELADPEIVPRIEFLLGNIAFARSLLAERQARAVEAEPFAIEVAIRRAKSARDRWRRAAMGRRDWPEARRNVERALRKIRELESLRKEPEGKKERTLDPRPLPVPDPGPEERRTDPDAEPEAQLNELTPEQVATLFDRLSEKEREKLEVRRARRRARMAEVEKDW
ncbi:MAG: hypothetical protein GF328_14020 [Candidatus Latescibacteria bacterium]|nr:hypothetical protein [Candidatus Latescibacterota bacterium]